MIFTNFSFSKRIICCLLVLILTAGELNFLPSKFTLSLTKFKIGKRLLGFLSIELLWESHAEKQDTEAI
jgi:hypothetical protein